MRSALERLNVYVGLEPTYGMYGWGSILYAKFQKARYIRIHVIGPLKISNLSPYMDVNPHRSVGCPEPSPEPGVILKKTHPSHTMT